MNTARKPAQQRPVFLIAGAVLILLPLIMAINALAQDATQVDVTAADRVAATYGVSSLASHILGSKTPAGRSASA
jgi:hypothetical protein